MEKLFSNITLILKKGDIANQADADAIVNAANAELTIGGGVAGAIHRKGDPELKELTRPLAPISPGEAVITEAPNLPNDYVIHCLGPVYGKDKPSDKLLTDCYRNALRLAEENGVNTIAFPAISTGAFGYPTEAAAKIAFKTIKEEADGLSTVKTVHFILFDQKALDIHKDVLESM
ncbi:macro domain-containing protein [Rhodohalobacter sp. 8-1]|uniref:macro domain-containing protein n=1 Tax=Rhodohalobacter sp. 8-1 TaxID=3131972 RepID=UPI0030EF8AA1